MKSLLLSVRRVSLISLLFICTFNTANASHNVGCTITYECLGSSVYEFTLTCYRDCNGINMPASTTLNFNNNGTCGGSVTSLTLPNDPALSGVDVSQLCDGEQSTCSGGTNQGTQQWVYSNTTVLPAGCVWTVSYSVSARSQAITNITGGATYVSTTVNTTVQPCNSSVQFSNLPLYYVCDGLQWQYNHGATDPDGDTLIFSLVCPFTSLNTCVTYTGALNPTDPMLLAPATTFDFDSITGQMTFTPQAGTPQVVIVSVKVEEVRNGVVIATTYREVQIVVLTGCTNSPPVVDSNGVQGSALYIDGTSLELCRGSFAEFNLVIQDPDGDSLTITSNIVAAVPGAIVNYTIDDSVVDSVVITFTVNSINLTPGIYPFSINVSDNACPVPSLQFLGYALKVYGANYTNNIYCRNETDPIPIIIGDSLGTFSELSTNPFGLVMDSLTGIIDLDSSLVGTYDIVYVLDSVSICPSDSITISIIDIPDASFSYPSVIWCKQGTSPPIPIITGTPGGDFSSPTASVNAFSGVIDLASTPIGSHQIFYDVVGGSCATQDTFTIDVMEMTSFGASASNLFICPNTLDTIQFNVSATYNGTTPTSQTYQWSPNQNIDNITIANPTVILLSPNTYSVIYNDSLCPEMYDTLEITAPYPAIVNPTSDVVLCNGNSAQIGASSPVTPGSQSFINSTPAVIQFEDTTYVPLVVSGIAPGIMNNALIASLEACMDINMLAIGHLEITLIAPSGESVLLMFHRGATQQFFPSSTFSIAGTNAPINTFNAPFPPFAAGAFYLPEGGVSSFSPLVGATVNGTWQLCIVHDNGGLTTANGLLNNWCMNFPDLSATSFEWTPATNISCTQCDSPTVNPPVNTTYTVVGTNTFGCTDTATVNVLLDSQLPTPNTTCGLPSISSVVFNWVPVFGAAGYSITVNGGAPQNLGPAIDSFEVTGLAQGQCVTFTITPLSGNTCADGIPDTIICCAAVCPGFGSAPGQTSGPTSFCPGGSVNLGIGAGYVTYLWSTGETTQVINVNTTQTVTVTATQPSGCQDTTLFNTLVFTPPTPSIVPAGSTNLCTGGSVSLDAGAGFSSYFWSPAGVTQAITVNSTANYIVTVTDANGCPGVDSISVVEGSPLTVNITGTNTTCNGMASPDGQALATGGGSFPPYTYLWSAGAQVDSIATGLSPGIHCVTLTDANTCTVSFCVGISEPPADTIGMSATNVTCFGAADGTASALGAVGNPVYIWSPSGQTTATATGLSAGLHCVTVTDTSGCAIINCITLTQPTATVSSNAVITSSFNSGSQISCATACDGEATASGLGGTPFAGGYNFTWDATASNQTTAIATGLCAGPYSVSVSDSIGCTSISTVTLTEPAAVTATIVSSTNPTCNGFADGQAEVLATSDTFTYTYAWSTVPVQTTAIATGLADNVYNVVVTDTNSCTANVSVTITEPSTVSVTLNVSSNFNGADVSCNGSCDGELTAVGAGGLGTHSYVWNSAPAQSTAIATGLCIGTYTVTATDTNSCVAIDSIIITEPTAVSVTTTQTNVSCFGGSDGTATAAGAGGTGAIAFTWSDGQTTAIATGLSGGSVCVTVTDANGCSADTCITIIEPAATVTSSASVTSSFNSGSQISCNGACDGEGTASGLGGTPAITGYTFAWDAAAGSQVTAIATGLCAGNYSVTVTDSLGCFSISTITVTEPSLVTAVISTSTNPSCNASTDGEATVLAGGGSSNYTYLWNTTPTGQTTATATGLLDGVYNVVATDTNGCAANVSVTITEPSVVSVTLSVSSNFNGADVSCNGSCDGELTAVGAGGTGVHAYVWNSVPAQSTAIATGLCIGTYTVTATDANNCPVVDSIIITEPTAVSVTTTQTNVSCFGGSDGTATVVGAGGTGAIAFTWSDGQTTAIATGLAGGSVCVTVTDANGCSADTCITIVEPAATVTSSASVTSSFNSGSQISCNGACDGEGTVSGLGGTPAITGYTFAWDAAAGSQATAIATGLCAGNYSVTVTDSLGCLSVSSITLTEPSAISVSITGSTDPSCNGGNNGDATALAIGGSPGYTYLWNTTPIAQSTATAVQLADGIYNVVATDTNGCATNVSVTITEPSAVSITTSISSNYNGSSISCNGASDGELTAIGSGGTGAHVYVWNTIPAQSTAIATGLVAGTYTVTSTDIQGCSIVDSLTISEPSSVTASSTSTNALCNGSADGTATAAGVGGTGAFSFVWTTSPAQSTAIATGLNATTNGGIYSATVSDVNGCTDLTTVTITEPSQVTATLSTTPVTCNGGDDGTATAIVGGGTPGIPPLPTYTYDWGNGFTAVATSPGSPLGTAGVHTVTISDDNGCTITENYTITEPSAMAFTVGATDVSCNGYSDGTASINVSGGVGGFTYVWNTSAQTTATATGLVAGMHCVTATDGNGCTVDTCIQVFEPSGFSNMTFNTIDVSCNGGSDGQLTVSINGAIQPYTYLWSNGQTDITATGLNATTHSVTISDANSCTVTGNAPISEPTMIQISLDVDSVLCKNGSDGQITASATGGTFPYTYMWDAAAGSQNTAIATGLAVGTYSVTVTDFNNCEMVASATVLEPLTILTASIIAQSNPTCNGSDDGSIEVDAQGATPNYTYQWSNGQTSSLASGITAGAHTVTVTDANGCSISLGGVLTDPSPIALNPQILSNYNGAAISCAGGSDGSVGVTAAGGTGLTYTYLWSPLGQNTATINGLFEGTYCVTVSDVEGCQADTCIVLNDPVPLAATFTKVDILCNGDNNGQILVNATPGTGTLGVNGYEYKITGPGQTGNVYSSINSYSNLVAGAYDVFVRDGNGCNVQLSIQITEPDSVLIDSVIIVDALCFGTATGTATAYASGGVGNFSYAWSGTANGQTTQMATGLAIGLYNVTVSDANGCDRVQIFNVGEASPLVGSITAGTISCMGGVTTATASASSGTPINTNTYLYNWSNGITSATTIGLTAGIHCVTITDANACTTIECVTITEPSTGISAIISAQTDVLCQGGSSGTATAQGVGGTSPYTYLWNNNAQTTQTATGLMVGVYTVSVTDTNGCPATAMVTITEPTAVAAVVVNATSTSCNGQSDGSAMAIGSGGTPGYTYLWANGETTQTATGLAGGPQTVTLTDANGCTTTAVTNIIDPPAIQITALNTTDVLCKGDATGTANIAVQGGNPIGGYIYQWSGTSQVGAIVSGLSAGSHSVTVSDVNGCSVVGTFTIGEPTDALTGYLTSADALCFGSATGELGAVIQGGTSATGAYNYLWNTTPVQSTVVADSLLAGTYTVTVTDDNLCSLVLTGSLGEASELSVTASVQQNVSCYGGSNGVAIANTATGGTPNYSYVWTDPTGQSTQVATNLMAGPVTVVVTDNNACTASATVTITEAAEITASANINHVSCNGGSDGSITISSSSVLVNYAWSTGIGNPLSGLAAGTYDLTVTDNFTCTETFSYTVTEPDVMAVTIAQTGDILCNGDNNGQAEVTTIGGTPNYSYNWTNGSNNSTASNLTPGTHMVTVMDSKGCSETVTISIAEPEALTITGTTTGTLCAGDETGSIAAFGSGGTTMGGLLQYSVDGTNWQSGNIFSGLTPGIHILSVQDQNGCTVDTSLVIEDADPFFITSMTADTLIEYLDSMLVYAMVNDTVNISINWSIISGAGTVVDSVYSFAIAPDDPVDYLFTATNANGCVVDSILMVDVKKPRRANAPMAFTPNGDGVNDYFFIQGGAKVKTVTLFRVYDRWGELVFEGSDLDINASTQGWDGNFRGQQSASGAYIWYAEVEFKDGHKEILKGDILLVR